MEFESAVDGFVETVGVREVQPVRIPTVGQGPVFRGGEGFDFLEGDQQFGGARAASR